MYRKILTLLLILGLLASLTGCGGQTGSVSAGKAEQPGGAAETQTEESETEHLMITVTDPGSDVFQPVAKISQDYRYGPSILLNEDGSMEAWFSSPGDGENEYDWVTWRHSDDGGETWSNEKVVLAPTPNSLDALSVCDPDAFYYDGYYYLGYTSTMDDTFHGLCNSVFLARAEKPEGPYEKWNGNGWGGLPKPIIYYDGISQGWGVGEPAFVILDDKIYVYSTRDSYSLVNMRIKTTEVRTADLTDENWPAKLKFEDYALVRSDTEDGAEYVYQECDSLDIAYVEEYGKFVGVCANRRFLDNSCLLSFESEDGIHFERVSEVNENVLCGCHNTGLMSDGSGHIKAGDPMMVGYSYAGKDNSTWGVWATRFAPISIDVVMKKDAGTDKENIRDSFAYSQRYANPWPILVGAESLTSCQTAGRTFTPDLYYMDSNYVRHYLRVEEVSIRDYDEKIISVADGVITALSPGTTTAVMEYQGLIRDLSFCVTSDSVSRDQSVREGPNLLLSPVESYDVPMLQAYAVAVRPLARFENYLLSELDGGDITNLGITFHSGNETICTVRDDGAIIPMSPGKTAISVESSQGVRYEVDVRVTEE